MEEDTCYEINMAVVGGGVSVSSDEKRIKCVVINTLVFSNDSTSWLCFRNENDSLIELSGSKRASGSYVTSDARLNHFRALNLQKCTKRGIFKGEMTDF